MATLIRLELVDGKAVHKTAVEVEWDRAINNMRQEPSQDAIAEGAFHVFSLNRKGNRAISRITYPDDCGVMEILKK